ncbi:MAG: cystathionine beta-lyase [Alteromonadaceae bacterium]|jgi:cystathionine beta-lyase
MIKNVKYSKMNNDYRTKLVHLGRSTAKSNNTVNPPLSRASTVVFNTLAEFKASYQQPTFTNLRYGRSGTSTVFELQNAMAELEQVESCIATACGLSAAIAVIAAHAGVGKHILVSEGVYGPVRAFCDDELIKQGTQVSYFSESEQLTKKIQSNTALIYLEVPASITMELIDISNVCKQAHKTSIPVACDSTWGTPHFFKPHQLGIDISIHAATKYINGHSDVMLGLITASNAYMPPIRQWCDRFGSHASPDACWLTLRGLRTLSVRMQQHQENAFIVANWLLKQNEVKKVIFPPLFTGKALELYQQQFSGCAGPFTFELHVCNETNFEKFIDGLVLFGLGTSWGGFESLVMPAIAHQDRAKDVMPDNGRLVRLHIGLEAPHDLCHDLRSALSHIPTP